MLRFILADLRRLWPGALVILLLIALAVALGTGVTLQERALRLGSARASEQFDLVVGARGSETQLVLSTVFLQAAPLPLVSGDVLSDLQRDPRVVWAAPVGFGDYHRGNPIVGTTTVLIHGVAPQGLTGRAFAREGEAVVGATVDLPMGARITPMHGEAKQGGHEHKGISYEVVGRMPATGTAWDHAILVPIQAVWHAHGMGDNQDHDDHDHDHAAAGAPDADAMAAEPEGHDHDHGSEDHDGHDDHAPGGFDPDQPLQESWLPGQAPGVPAILVKPRTVADAYRLRQEYRKDERSLAVFPGEVLTKLYGMLGDARQVLAAVAAGVQALVALALLLVTVIHIGQRRRQIGALRALGVPSPTIFALVWVELFALIAAGVALGLAGGYLAARLLSAAIAERQGFGLPVEITAGDLLTGLLLLGLAALLALLPAWIAYRQSPVASLRG